MSEIVRISSNTPWEPIVGYSRLVKAGEIVAVSGTTATDERGLIVGAGQMYAQARQALENIQRALGRAGLSMQNVVRTRIFVTDITRFAEVARAHKEFFADSPPATSMVEVRRLVHPDMLIEIEADAHASAASEPAPAETPMAPTKKASGAAPKPNALREKKSKKAIPPMSKKASKGVKSSKPSKPSRRK